MDLLPHRHDDDDPIVAIDIVEDAEVSDAQLPGRDRVVLEPLAMRGRLIRLVYELVHR